MEMCQEEVSSFMKSLYQKKGPAMGKSQPR